MKPAIITIPPRDLKDRLPTDPQLNALLDQGYTLGATFVLVDGPDGPEQRMDLALVLLPPGPAVVSQAQPFLPRWAVILSISLVLAFLLGQSVLLLILTVRG